MQPSLRRSATRAAMTPVLMVVATSACSALMGSAAQAQHLPAIFVKVAQVFVSHSMQHHRDTIAVFERVAMDRRIAPVPGVSAIVAGPAVPRAPARHVRPAASFVAPMSIAQTPSTAVSIWARTSSIASTISVSNKDGGSSSSASNRSGTLGGYLRSALVTS